jgi:hypothetical protein
MSSMKGRNSSANESDLDKNNIIKPTFDTWMEVGRKAIEAYHANLEELFYSCYEMMRQRATLKDIVLIIIHKVEVTPEVWPNPTLSLNEVQSIINSVLERQAKSTGVIM